jgi:hypothetical protein
MPRTTRNDQEGAVAEREPIGRAARGRSAEAASTPAASRPSETATESQTVSPDGPTDAPRPAYDDIARRAYELYQQRGSGDGQEVDDWLRAEAELRDAPGRRADEK